MKEKGLRGILKSFQKRPLFPGLLPLLETWPGKCPVKLRDKVCCCGAVGSWASCLLVCALDQHEEILMTKSTDTLIFCCYLVAKSCPTLWPMDCTMPGFPVLHCLQELAEIHVHWVSDAIQPSHPLSSPSPAFRLSQHQGLFQWVSCSHQVAKMLELQPQHQSFQWVFRVDFL